MISLENRQSLALMALRVSLGLLLFWWGLNRVVAPGDGMNVQKKFYSGLFPGEALQQGFGLLQLTIGLLVIAGLWRKFAVPAQLLITGFSAATIWSALLDPFGLWLPVEKIASIQHLFYPSVIALCGAMVLLAFRSMDRWALDAVLARRPTRSAMQPGE